MAANDDLAIKTRIDRIRDLAGSKTATQWYEGASLALSVVHDTLGGNHPIMADLEGALSVANNLRVWSAIKAVVTLYDDGCLKNPRLAIAGEIEGDILNIAQDQAAAAEKTTDISQKHTHLGIAAFLAGASLEDALRRLCDARGISYDAQRTSLSKLQAALYQPAKQIEVLSSSENKHITAWGDTRNKADHGKFAEITHTEVVAMVLGTRSFIEKHLS